MNLEVNAFENLDPLAAQQQRPGDSNRHERVGFGGLLGALRELHGRHHPFREMRLKMGAGIQAPPVVDDASMVREGCNTYRNRGRIGVPAVA